MANLKEIRNRITSVSSTMQITSAMKMVSAAKLKKAQDAITAMRPYSEKLTELLQNLSASLEGAIGGEFTREREVKRVLIVAISSNRGLAGAFNSNVLKETRRLTETVYAGKQVDYYTVGKKGYDILKKTDRVIANNVSVFDDLTFENVSAITDELVQLFLDGKYDKIVLVYNQFKNAATQVIQEEQLLPLVSASTEVKNQTEYIYEPEKEEIIMTLIPKMLRTQVYKAVRDSFASEHGARMTAMHKATDNATELRNQLKLTYNKARQAAITGEILEIVGGAEALNS